MKKLLTLALALTLALVVSLCPVTLAASTLKASEATTEVEKKLANLQTQSGYRPGDKGGQCFPFARNVFKSIFGVEAKPLYYHGNNVNSDGMIRVGRCFVDHKLCPESTESGDCTTISTTTVKDLLSKAKCGDLIQTTRICYDSSGNAITYPESKYGCTCPVARPHTMIVQQVKSDSIVLYESNFSGPAETISTREITFKNFASTYNHTIALFHAKNYDKVNGSSNTAAATDNVPATSSLTISPTTFPSQNMPKGQPFYFKGKITSNCNITFAEVRILSPDSKSTFQSKTIHPNTPVVDIATSGLDSLKFGELPDGAYKLYLRVGDASATVKEWEHSFSIGLGTTSTLSINCPSDFFPEVLPYGADYSLSGSITSNYNVKSVIGRIYQPDGKTVIEEMVLTPNAKTVDIGTCGVNALSFQYLEPGKYYFRLSAEDESGTGRGWGGYFTIEKSIVKEPEIYNIAIQYFLDGTRISTYNIPIKHGDSTAFDLRIERSDIPALVALESGTWDKAYSLAFVDVRSNITANLYYETPEEETPVPTSTPSSKPEPTSKPTATAQPTSKPSTTPEPAPEPSATPAATSSGSLSNFHSVNTYYSGLFYDVASSDWFDENVSRAYELGLMKGMSEDAFGPTSSVTVAQAVTLAARLHSIYYTGSEDFVQSGKNWYDVYVTYARNNGIHYNTYDYSGPISRGDFAYILAKALPAEALPAIDSDIYFDDVESTTPYQKYIYLLAQAGIIRGVPNIFGTLDFQPNDSITRAQVAAIVTRMADPSLRQ